MDLPGDYSVSATFNISDLSPFEIDAGIDSRTNPFEGRGNDANKAKNTQDTQRASEGDLKQILNDVNTNTVPNLESFSGPVTRSNAKKLKELL